ncbi:hypothetical protein [Hydrogenophaga soli]
MATKRSLYDILGIAQDAPVEDIQNAYQDRLTQLEQARERLGGDQFNDRLQVLRLALSTLTDAAARLSYDAKLAASRPASTPSSSPPSAQALSLAPLPADAASVQAEALSLRADALALRADAMLLRAGLESQLARPAEPAAMQYAKLFTRAVGLLVIVGVSAFALTRCMTSRTQVDRLQMESQASEKAALQDYQNTHGVRPANVAEMELLEAERRKAENQQRTTQWEKEKAEEAQRRFLEESRRRGEQVAEDLRRAEEQARLRAEREDERLRAIERAKEEAEQRRLEKEREHWQSILRR